MSDSLDSSALRGLWWRVPLLLALVVLVPPIACNAVFIATHPAPLGRDRDSILANVDRALPPGTSFDSAGRYFEGLGLGVDRYTAADAERSFRGDTLLAGGPVLFVVQPATTRGLYLWNGYVKLYFGADDRLVRRDADLIAVNPS
jgi:hypothetical protein